MRKIQKKQKIVCITNYLNIEAEENVNRFILSLKKPATRNRTSKQSKKKKIFFSLTLTRLH